MQLLLQHVRTFLPFFALWIVNRGIPSSLRTTIVSMIQCPSSPSQLRFIHSCDGSSPTGQSGGYCFERYAVFSFAPPFTRPVNTLDPSAWVFRGNSRTQLSQDMMTCTKIGTSRNQWNCNVMGSLGELPCVFRLSLISLLRMDLWLPRMDHSVVD